MVSYKKDFQDFVTQITKEYISSSVRHLAQIFLASRSNYPVLILGPTGTGKELVANAIHKYGLRRDKPLVTVNCALIPKDHLYGELFGVEGGRYTGVIKTRKGLFEEADGGTIFLDEIGDLPLDAQAGLLRILETGKIRRLGQEEREAEKFKKIDVRIISATNKDIALIDDFRKDLFYRLKVIPISLDPINKRQSDIPYLIKKFLIPEGIEIIDFHFYAFCITNNWEGNIRELKNFCLHASLSHVENKVYLFRSVGDFFASGSKSKFDNAGYFNWKSPYPVDAVEQLPELRFHNYISTDYEKPNEVISYLNYLKFLQEGGYGQTINAIPIMKKRKTSWDITYKGKNRKVIEFLFPDIWLKDIPEFELNNNMMTLSPEDSENAKWLKSKTGQILGTFWDFERYEKSITNADNYTKDIKTDFKTAKSKFEQNYFNMLFDKYPNLSDNAIAKLAGLDPKTIKKKRSKYIINV